MSSLTQPTPSDRLYAEALRREFRISKTTFHVYLKAGKFDRFEILPRIGRRCWSRALLDAYNRGEMRPARVFGRRTEKLFGRGA